MCNGARNTARRKHPEYSAKAKGISDCTRRIAGLQCFRKLRQDYWTWHFDESLSDAARLLLSKDLGWEAMPQLTTPPVGEVISPLGYALSDEDKHVRDAALHVLDATVHIPAGIACIGKESAPLEVDEFRIGVYPVTKRKPYNSSFRMLDTCPHRIG